MSGSPGTIVPPKLRAMRRVKRLVRRWKSILTLCFVLLCVVQPSTSLAKDTPVHTSWLNQVAVFLQSPLQNTLHSSHREVIPGGQSIGIKLHAKGILVVGYYLVHQGKTAFSPGERSLIHVGDVILSVNHKDVLSVDEVAKMIDVAGKNNQSLQVVIKRKQSVIPLTLKPAFDDETGLHRIGLYIRDSASGVGTLTFFEPQRSSFGALGHVIADVDTGNPIDGRGQIVHASVTSIDRGESGQPGEKRGLFVNDHQVLGEINSNTDFGVFGKMNGAPDHGFTNRLIPVAHPSEVHIGPAQILTVVHGQKVESFNVKIIQINHQDHADVKGLVIQVTDPLLIQKTGGIVQGMSGSPILEDGKLVGAVTHVFVSNPLQGYGVYAEWMLQHVAK